MRPEPTVILSFNCDVPAPANITGQSIVFVFDVMVLVLPDEGINVQAFAPALRPIEEFKVKSPYIVSTLLFTLPVYVPVKFKLRSFELAVIVRV